ncbi:MAG: HPr family phosphocarrier protein [Verrucomicrobiota bacterium]
MFQNEQSNQQKATRRLRLNTSMGLHARPASLMAKTAAQFSAKVTVRTEADDDPVNAASVLGILTLAAEPGAHLEFVAEGHDALDALDALEKLFNDNFGEK